MRQQDVPQVHLQSRELVTRFQIESILQVTGMMASALGHWMRGNPLDEDQKLTPCETEARIAAENTMRAACARLDKILEEDARWSMEFQTKVEKQFEDAQKMQMEVLTSQLTAAREVTSPHFRYRPTILRLVDGTWAAFLGDLNDMENGVIGVGITPQDAIEAFDDAWRGVANEKVLQWAREREQDLENGKETKPFPLINEKQNLDEHGNKKTENSSGEGSDSQADSGSSGTFPCGG